MVHACAGEWSTARSFENFLKTAYSLHAVTYKKEEWGVPVCEMGNPAELNCATSKGFKSYGIDSHVLAINHLLGTIDLYDLLGVLDTARKSGSGFTSGNPVPCPPSQPHQHCQPVPPHHERLIYARTYRRRAAGAHVRGQGYHRYGEAGQEARAHGQVQEVGCEEGGQAHVEGGGQEEEDRQVEGFVQPLEGRQQQPAVVRLVRR